MPEQRYLANCFETAFRRGAALHWAMYEAKRWASHISSRLGGGPVGPWFCCFLSSNL